MNKLSIRDLEMGGKRVFMRVDFNVPLDGARVTDDTRIRETLPTLEFARKRGARLVLASHLGRPKGKPDPKYSLKPVAAKLAELLGAAVDFAADCVGADAEAKSRALANGGVLLLENVRYHAEEEANDENFSRQLAALCDGLFVCDAFGSAHRAHASVVGITRFVKQAAAGLLMERELAYLGKALSNPERPFVAVLGGAKVSDKIEVVENLMRVADAMLIGGGMAYTFLKSQGLPIGNSLVEADKLDLARKLLAEAKQRNFRLLLPTDHVLGAEFKPDTETQTTSVNATPDGWMGLDIGPDTIAKYSARSWRARKQLCGTARWACSRCRRSPRARWKSRARSRRRRRRAPRPSWAAEIPSLRFTRPDLPTKFPTSRPAAAHRLNFWAAGNCRAWKR